MIIGCGSIGRRHAKFFSIRNNTIYAVDTNPERLELIQKECKIKKTFNDIDKALKEKIDAAIIATPPHIHTDISIKCAKLNIHLFIEKPLSVNKNGLIELNQMCINNNLTCYVAYCYRYIPSVVQLKKYIDNNKIGKVLSYRLWISFIYPIGNPWEDYRNFYMHLKNKWWGNM